MRLELGHARRYAQCHFVHIGALEHFMLQQIVCIFHNFVKAPSSSANKQTLKFHQEYICFVTVDIFLVPLINHTSYGMMMLCQQHS